MKEICAIPIALSVAPFGAEISYGNALSFQKHGCLLLWQTKSLRNVTKRKQCISSSSSAGPLPRSLVLPRSVWAAEVAAGNPGKLPVHPHKTGGEKGWSGLLSIGKGTIEPWRRESDVGYVCWSWQTHTCSGMSPGNPVSQSLSLGWAMIGWKTLVPFFLQRFPAQECHSPSAILTHNWPCYQWPCGL